VASLPLFTVVAVLPPVRQIALLLLLLIVCRFTVANANADVRISREMQTLRAKEPLCY
jgi:hypothetical protein